MEKYDIFRSEIRSGFVEPGSTPQPRIPMSTPLPPGGKWAFIGTSTGLSLRAGGRGFSPATKRVAPGYFYWKIEEK